MAFAKQMVGFPLDLVSFSNQTKLPLKRHEKIHVTFFTVFTAKNMTRILSRLFDESLVKNEFKSDRNPIIFFESAMEIS